MADLLNAIIAAGGTTSMTEQVTAAGLAGRAMAKDAVCHVAEQGGAVVGFQWIAPRPALPSEAADIATFVMRGRTGSGIGSALFGATRKAAAARGYRWINATIRADNAGGLAYYRSVGFREWARLEGQVLGDGTVVDKLCKRFDLT